MGIFLTHTTQPVIEPNFSIRGQGLFAVSGSARSLINEELGRSCRFVDGVSHLDKGDVLVLLCLCCERVFTQNITMRSRRCRTKGDFEPLDLSSHPQLNVVFGRSFGILVQLMVSLHLKALRSSTAEDRVKSHRHGNEAIVGRYVESSSASQFECLCACQEHNFTFLVSQERHRYASATTQRPIHQLGRGKGHLPCASWNIRRVFLYLLFVKVFLVSLAHVIRRRCRLFYGSRYDGPRSTHCDQRIEIFGIRQHIQCYRPAWGSEAELTATSASNNGIST